MTPGNGAASAADDELYQRAVAVVRQERRGSTSLVMRRLQIGYNQAARFIARMEQEGVIGSPPDHDPAAAIAMTK
jgi:S-DNA-T family DNA segregation ATPase FtsK/SpoIIIE